MLRYTQGTRLKAWSGAPAFLPESQALFARFTTPPSLARMILINTMISSLITAGVWAKLDALYVMAQYASQPARQNWIADAYNLSPVSSPAFTADRGYQGDGLNAYLTTGFIPSTAPSAKYTLNAASMGFWSRTAAASANAADIDMGPNTTAPRADLRARRPGDTAGYLINDATLAVPASTDGSGYFSMIRTGASARQLRRNKVQLASDTTASTGLPITGVSLLAAGNVPGRSARQLALGFIGSLNAADSDALYDATLVYLQAVGAA